VPSGIVGIKSRFERLSIGAYNLAPVFALEGTVLAMEVLRIPKFSENMEEATVVEWLKGEGDPVQQGDLMLSVITDKADVEIEAETSGTLLKVIAPEKSSVPVGYVVGLIGSPGEPFPDYETMNREVTEQFALELERRAREESEKAPDEPEAKAPPRTLPPHDGAAGRVAATPAAKRLSREHGIELAQVRDWAKAEGPVSQEMVEAFLRERQKS
jgi:pyruvate dehydrogenase E2 component (dihydrolipoamide acetyltransferase)